jgi:hypothetical protein
MCAGDSANAGVHELFKLLAVCRVDIDHHILVCVCVFGRGGGGRGPQWGQYLYFCTRKVPVKLVN